VEDWLRRSRPATAGQADGFDSHQKMYRLASVYYTVSCFLIFTGAIAAIHINQNLLALSQVVLHILKKTSLRIKKSWKGITLCI
jgi:hypothetical protein